MGLVLSYDLLEDRHIADITINDFYASLLYKTNTIYVAVTDRVAPPMPLFGSQHIWTSSVIYYCTDRLPHGIYFLTLISH